MGIFTDLLLDAPLGLNALSFVLITFGTRYLIRERRILTFANSWVIAVIASSCTSYFFMDKPNDFWNTFFDCSPLATAGYQYICMADCLLLFT